MNGDIINKSGNKHCVICTGKNPSWGCYPFGVLVCTKCAGGMREMGTDSCVVKSLLLDSVSPEFLRPFLLGSNSLFLDWFGTRGEELEIAFFKTRKAQEYAEKLEKGEIKEKTVKNAPKIEIGSKNKNITISGKSQKKSKLKIISDSEKNTESEEEDACREEEPVEKGETLKKKVIKRVPGKMVTSESGNASRLGMFKKTHLEESSEKQDNPERQSKEIERSSVHKYSTKSMARVLTGDAPEEKTDQTEIIKGKNFIGSAPVQKETVTERLKKSLDKGKKSLLNRFMK